MNISSDSLACTAHTPRLHPFFAQTVDSESTKELYRWALVGLLALPSLLPAWGRLGHETVAHIAESRLTAKTKVCIEEILGPGKSLASVAMWADQVKRRWPASRPWHYIDLSIEGEVMPGDLGQYCRANGCVVSKLDESIAEVNTPSASAQQREVALKFIVHLVGDIHQPLHCANDDDKGGNGKVVWYQGRQMRLHELWDNCIEKYPRGNSFDLARSLNGKITKQDAQEWETGDPDTWAYESYVIARDRIYPSYRSTEGKNLGQSYKDLMRPMVDLQLEKAGVRLAWLLNRELGANPYKK
jgi:hypothetical protein